ncbi:hypothetical protein EON66_07785, partial [archaeon]
MATSAPLSDRFARLRVAFDDLSSANAAIAADMARLKAGVHVQQTPSAPLLSPHHQPTLLPSARTGLDASASGSGTAQYFNFLAGSSAVRGGGLTGWAAVPQRSTTADESLVPAVDSHAALPLHNAAAAYASVLEDERVRREEAEVAATLLRQQLAAALRIAQSSTSLMQPELQSAGQGVGGPQREASFSSAACTPAAASTLLASQSASTSQMHTFAEQVGGSFSSDSVPSSALATPAPASVMGNETAQTGTANTEALSGVSGSLLAQNLVHIAAQRPIAAVRSLTSAASAAAAAGPNAHVGSTLRPASNSRSSGLAVAASSFVAPPLAPITAAPPAAAPVPPLAPLPNPEQSPRSTSGSTALGTNMMASAESVLGSARSVLSSVTTQSGMVAALPAGVGANAGVLSTELLAMQQQVVELRAQLAVERAKPAPLS